MLRRRKSQSPELAAFLQTAEHIDAAQRVLLSAVPTSRDRGQSLPVALEGCQRLLHVAKESMAGWPEQLATKFHGCFGAIDAALAESEELQGVESLPFEELNSRLGDVLHPLEEFADAERAMRRGLG